MPKRVQFPERINFATTVEMKNEVKAAALHLWVSDGEFVRRAVARELARVKRKRRMPDNANEAALADLVKAASRQQAANAARRLDPALLTVAEFTMVAHVLLTRGLRPSDFGLITQTSAASEQIDREAAKRPESLPESRPA